jgi:hypothetical protein
MENKFRIICQINSNYKRFAQISLELLDDFLKTKDSNYLLSDDEIDNLYHKTQAKEINFMKKQNLKIWNKKENIEKPHVSLEELKKYNIVII